MKTKNFNDQSSKIILKIIGSENARKILKSTSKCPMSASQISTECDIPLTKTYRWIKKLQNMKFLQTSGMVSSDQKKTKTEDFC